MWRALTLGGSVCRRDTPLSCFIQQGPAPNWSVTLFWLLSRITSGGFKLWMKFMKKF